MEKLRVTLCAAAASARPASGAIAECCDSRRLMNRCRAVTEHMCTRLTLLGHIVTRRLEGESPQQKKQLRFLVAASSDTAHL